MALVTPISSPDVRAYHQMLGRSMDLRSHFDLLLWLQGDVQRYLPHHIMIASWGNFAAGEVRYDIVSPLPGVRSRACSPAMLVPMLRQLFCRWTQFKRKPFQLAVGDKGFFLGEANGKSAFADALQRMQCALVHGIPDTRGQYDCLYMAFTATAEFSKTESNAMAAMLPHIDLAWRQVAPSPSPQPVAIKKPRSLIAVHEPEAPLHGGLSSREMEIVNWVGHGKTNADIGLILGISEFTVKNHLQRIYKKLYVSNRAQATHKLSALLNHA